MSALSEVARASDYHRKALDELTAAREGKPKALRKAVKGAGRLLGWASVVAEDDTPERQSRRYRIEAAAAAGVTDDTPSDRREAFYRLLDRAMAEGVGTAKVSAGVSAAMSGIDYRNVERHRLARIERTLGERQAEADLRGDDHHEAPVYVDVAALLADDFEAPIADAGGVRSDLARLAYKGKVTTFAGETGAGKTFIAMAFVIDEMRRSS